jgi:BirA family biotin operon repressor/biotin-[acetyl-CoA-carboxylase] ligase
MVADVKGSSATSRLTGTRFADVRWFDEVGSTNADLLALAAEGAAEGLVLVADHQTAGRGRLDRTWEALPGSSLLVSVLLRPRLHPDETFLLTNAAAVAAVDACQETAGVRPGVKWPNDLVVVAGDRHRGRKLGGILAEARMANGRVEAVVVGMGLNVNWPPDLPPELADVAAALNHVVGHEVDREDLLVAWLRHLDARLAALDGAEGRTELDADLRRASATLGRSVRVELPGGRIVEGDAVDLTPGGHLLVAPADGGPVLEVTVGDVVHLRHRA